MPDSDSPPAASEARPAPEPTDEDREAAAVWRDLHHPNRAAMPFISDLDCAYLAGLLAERAAHAQRADHLAELIDAGNAMAARLESDHGERALPFWWSNNAARFAQAHADARRAARPKTTKPKETLPCSDSRRSTSPVGTGTDGPTGSSTVDGSTASSAVPSARSNGGGGSSSRSPEVAAGDGAEDGITDAEIDESIAIVREATRIAASRPGEYVKLSDVKALADQVLGKHPAAQGEGEADAELDRVRLAMQPVRDWYDGDGEKTIAASEMVACIVKDLQDDRADCLRMAAALRRLRDAGNADKNVESWMREIIDAALPPTTTEQP